MKMLEPSIVRPMTMPGSEIRRLFRAVTGATGGAAGA